MGLGHTTRRETIALIGTGLAFAGAARATAAGEDCPSLETVDRVCAPVLALLPEAALRVGLADPAAAARCDDPSADGSAAVALAVAGARAALPVACDAPYAIAATALLDAANATRDIRYGCNDPTAAIHRPYRVTAFAGPHVGTTTALALWQPPATPDDVEVWQAKLDALGGALLAVAQALRADEAMGCVPPQLTARAALAPMDAFALVRATDHPLVAALAARLGETTGRDAALARAAATLERRVQPAMALLRDTVAALTRKGRSEPGLWTQPDGDALYAANVARAADSAMTLADATALGRDEARRIGVLLDKRLATRGYRTGTLADRIAAGFAAHPALVAADDATGREALRTAARAQIEAVHADLGALVPPALAATPALRVAGLPDLGAILPGGSFYAPAAGTEAATLWLDDRSVFALPIPGVAPLACRLGLPGAHLLNHAGTGSARTRLAVAARWPGMSGGWSGYAERLAAEQGLFARDPWGDIARLSDELLRAARLVVDIGIHRERWPRERAEAEMVAMTGARQTAAIDRIVALPGEAAAFTIPQQRLLDLRTAARNARRFDAKTFDAALLAGGARPLALVEREAGRRS